MYNAKTLKSFYSTRTTFLPYHFGKIHILKIPDNINVWSSQSAQTAFTFFLLLEPSLWTILSMGFPRVVVFSAIFPMMNSLSDCLKKTASSLYFWSTFSAHKDFSAGQLFHHFGKIITLPSFAIVSVESELLVYCHFLKLLSILLYDCFEGSAFVSSA